MERLLLFTTRTLRMFGFGSVGVIFAVYPHQLGLSDQRIGLLLTLTLLGDSIISLSITLFADRGRQMEHAAAWLHSLAASGSHACLSFVPIILASHHSSDYRGHLPVRE